MIDNLLAKSSMVHSVFYKNQRYRIIYLEILDALIWEVDSYQIIREFIDGHSIFYKLLQREDSIYDSLGYYGRLLDILDSIIRFFDLSDEEKDHIRFGAKTFVQNLIYSRDDLDEFDLDFILFIENNLGILNDGDDVRINKLVDNAITGGNIFSIQYIDYIKRSGMGAIQHSREVLDKLYEQVDSDIIKSQIIELMDSSELSSVEMTELQTRDSPEDVVKQTIRIIDEIRSDLMVDSRKLNEQDFYGHYTKINTLVNFLFKPEENKKSESPIYLRLSNANQMNDPMEGKILSDVLGLEKYSDKCYRATNVFLSSLTVAKDSLPMWKEYADESRGAFLEYDMNYLETIVKHDAIEFARVHYIFIDDNRNIIEHDNVDKKLNNIKKNIEFLEQTGNTKEIYEITDYISKISYLFKVSDYKYEVEYRILVNLDDAYFTDKLKPKKTTSEIVSILNSEEIQKYLLDSNVIKKPGVITISAEGKNYYETIGKHLKDKSSIRKINDIGLLESSDVNYDDYRKYIHLERADSGKCHLYVYINVAPLKYSRVMLGPKVEDVDYIAPYLHYIQPDIVVETSSIPYR